MGVHGLCDHKVLFVCIDCVLISPRPACRSLLKCPATVQHSYYDILAGAVQVEMLGPLGV